MKNLYLKTLSFLKPQKEETKMVAHLAPSSTLKTSTKNFLSLQKDKKALLVNLESLLNEDDFESLNKKVYLIVTSSFPHKATKPQNVLLLLQTKERISSEQLVTNKNYTKYS